MAYKVVDFEIGLYDYDTLFVKVEKETIQIPIKKGIGKPELIGKEIEIKQLNTPIEKI